MYLYADVDEPAEEEHAQVDGVDDGQRGQVDAARHTAQVSTGEHEARDDVADDADHDNDRHRYEVHHVHKPGETGVARIAVVVGGVAVGRRTGGAVPTCVCQQRRFASRHRRRRRNSTNSSLGRSYGSHEATDSPSYVG